MDALLSPSREKEAEGNVRAALWLPSARWAEPPGWASPTEDTSPRTHTWPEGTPSSPSTWKLKVRASASSRRWLWPCNH